MAEDYIPKALPLVPPDGEFNFLLHIEVSGNIDKFVSHCIRSMRLQNSDYAQYYALL